MCRNKEVDLFWKRFSFYWTIQGGIIITYASSAKDNLPLKVILTSFGVFSSLVWMMINIGSQQSLNDWEVKLKETSKEVVGDLFIYKGDTYQTTWDKEGTPYDIQGLSILFSFSMIMGWGFFAIQEWTRFLFSDSFSKEYILGHYGLFLNITCNICICIFTYTICNPRNKIFANKKEKDLVR